MAFLPDSGHISFLGKGIVKSAEQGGDDEETMRSVDAMTKLYRLCDESGEMVTTEALKSHPSTCPWALS